MTRGAVRLGGLLLALLSGAGLMPDDARPGLPADHMVVAAYVPTWEDRVADSLPRATGPGGVTELSPTSLTIDTDGELVRADPAGELREAIAEATADPGVHALPVVQNFADGRWLGDRTAELLADPWWAAAHRRELVRTAVRLGWDGIDVDYERLPPTAGPAFTDFLAALADDLHAEGLLLSVAVPARTSEQESWSLAYSYRVLGRIADQVRVMAYDHAWGGSAPGPVAPLPWVREVVRHAVEEIPREKVMLGLATFGYDWVAGQGTYVMAADAADAARRAGVRPRWHAGVAASAFTYVAEGRPHTVWYEDARSLEAKQQVAVDAGLRGVFLWSLGGEDPRVWSTVLTASAGAGR